MLSFYFLYEDKFYLKKVLIICKSLKKSEVKNMPSANTFGSSVNLGRAEAQVIQNLYELAVANGFKGTVTEFLASLQGPSGTIQIGAVTSTDPGTAPTVTNSGTPQNAVFNFGIPQGKIPDIKIGTVEKGDSANATITGTTEKPVLNLVLPKGDKGDQGLKGNAGTISVGNVQTGNPGTNVIITNSGSATDGILDFTIPRGDKGDAATVNIGTVITGAAGSEASVTNVGTANAAILNFSLPQGVQGVQGPSGTNVIGNVTSGVTPSITNVGTAQNAIWDVVLPKGDQGPKGDTGETGPRGAAATVQIGNVTTGSTSSVTNSGTDTDAVLNFVLEKGEQGIPGQAASVAIGNVATVAPDQPAQVVNSGTSSAAVLSFNIPQGVQGIQGPKGEKGDLITYTIGNVSDGAVPSVTIEDTAVENEKVLNFVLPNAETLGYELLTTEDIDAMFDGTYGE